MKRLFPLKSTQNFLLFFLLTTVTVSLSAQQDTLYFTSKWKPTVKDSASFFRPPVKKEGDLFKIQDYYISGQVQMEAFSKSSEKDLWQGKVTWYNEDGSIFQEGNYKNNRLEGDFITFMQGERLVATCKNGRIVSGKRNTPYGSGQMYIEQKGDTLYEVVYDKDIKGIRSEHWGTKNNYRFLSKYYGANGDFIGERKLLPNNYYKGVEVLYFYDPMRVKKINYEPFGQLLISETYYPNGQIREKVTHEPDWSKTYYSSDGEKIAEITYQLDQKRLKPFNGTVLFFAYGKNFKESHIIERTQTYIDGLISKEDTRYESGKLKSETTYKNDIKELQISYDESGKENNRMVYKNYRPFEGTEIQKGRIATYREGELVEETNFYLNTDIPQIKKTKTLETYYDKNGKVLGTLQLTYDNGYSKPKEGKRFTMDYREGDISSIEEFKEGAQIRRTSFRKRLVGKDTSKTFKRIEEYGPEGYKKVKEIKFYSNEKKQSEITYKDYKEIYGKFYDENQQLIGSYDYEKKDGTLYKFFGDSDKLELMEELKEGKMQRLKRYNYGKSAEYGQINPVLEQDIDINCCATFYNLEGEVIAKLTYKNQLPWEGTAYDHSAKTKYVIKEGKRNGKYQKLDYNQNVLEEGQFVDDKEEGTFNYYDYQGNLLRTENFTNGQLNGKSSYFDKNGNLVSEMEYKNGLPMNGIRATGYRAGEGANQETYKDGKLMEYIFYEKDRKSITTYESTTKSQTVSYHKDSTKKRLSYGMTNSVLEGAVIRYDSEGKEQHRAVFKKGRLVSGTIYLVPRYQDTRVQYMEVTKEAEKLTVRFIDFENKVVLHAEEQLIPGSTAVYLDKLDVKLDYLSASRLY